MSQKKQTGGILDNRCSDPSEKRYAVLVVKVPYTMHIVTQLPQHKHLHEESNAKHYIEEKLVTRYGFGWFLR